MANRQIEKHPERIERVYLLMERENLSQTKLAKEIGVTQQRVSYFLKTERISDYNMDKIKAAFPNYLPEWLDGYGDPEIATKEELAIHKFNQMKISEEDLTDYFSAIDDPKPLQRLLNNLFSIHPTYRREVLETLNRIVEPYTMIPGWEY